MTERNPTDVQVTAREALYHQQQCDEDGVMCIVSRQALHEVLAEYDTLRAALQQSRSAVTDADETTVRVAKAILNHRSPMMPDLQWAIETDETRQWYIELANAALAALSQESADA